MNNETKTKAADVNNKKVKNTETEITASDNAKANEPDVESAEVSMKVVEPKITPQVASMWNNTKMFNLAYKLAGFLGQSDLVPQAYQGKLPNCLIAIDIANRMGISPMSVMQNSQVVRGKFSWTGSACKSMIDGCGRFKKPTIYREVGKKGDDTWGFYLEGETKDGQIIKGVEVTVGMAKQEGWYSQNPKWRTLTELMLKYRCAAFFMRTECAGLAMGFLTAEENEDLEPETPRQSLTELLDAETT